MCCRKLGAIAHKPASFGFQEEKSAPSALQLNLKGQVNKQDASSIPAFNLDGALPIKNALSWLWLNPQGLAASLTTDS